MTTKPRANWLQTFTGKQFWVTDPDPDAIDIIDIAHALSNLCRYNGHVQRFLSVAEHCVMVSRAVPREDALWALLHDASEAYCGDMVKPLKTTPELAGYVAIEDRVQQAVGQHFGLPWPMPASVHEMDTRVLLNERAMFHATVAAPWGIEHLEPAQVQYVGWSPTEARQQYLDRFAELISERALVTA